MKITAILHFSLKDFSTTGIVTFFYLFFLYLKSLSIYLSSLCQQFHLLGPQATKKTLELQINSDGVIFPTWLCLNYVQAHIFFGNAPDEWR